MDGDDAHSNAASTPSVETLPVPVVGYDVRAGDPVVTATNDAFDAAFERDPTGTRLRHWLRTASTVEAAVAAELSGALATGKAIDTDVELTATVAATAGSDAYRLRTWDGTPASDAVEGYVLLTESTDSSDGSVGADRIASVVSHDLRNPLDVANAHLQAARETGAEEHFDAVRRSHDRMERIIRDVLTLARGENALAVDADVDVGRVAAEAWATVDTGDAELSVAPDLPTTDADPDRLQRLFENVFRNSVDHARPTRERSKTSNTNGRGDVDGHGGVDGSGDEEGDGDSDQPLQVRVGSTGEGFFVADDGVGIPDSERERVFDPGYSSDRTGDGTGLGLTIVERIAAAHDWRVDVATSAGGGARFEFGPRSDDD